MTDYSNPAASSALGEALTNYSEACRQLKGSVERVREAQVTIETMERKAAAAKLTPLTEDQVSEVFRSMPGGLDGFLRSWGWLPFARAIEAMHGIGCSE